MSESISELDERERMLTPPGSVSALEALARTAFGSPDIQRTLVNAHVLQGN